MNLAVLIIDLDLREW